MFPLFVLSGHLQYLYTILFEAILTCVNGWEGKIITLFVGGFFLAGQVDS